ncbi:twin-arginine translocase TatA/TatE family subunit [Salinimonas profundi]|nr:twin-arginine translocase TatA/TatE family subunit [Salinimonas profundi]
MWQVMLVLLIVILLFGRGRIPALMGDVASGIRSFKHGLQDDNTDTPTQPSAQQNVEHKADTSTIQKDRAVAEQKNA